MSADMEIRADMPRYDVLLASQADDVLAPLLGLLDAQNMDTEIERRTRMLSAAANMWAHGYVPDAPAPLRPVPQTASLTTTPPTEHALAANVGANSDNLETLADGGGVSGGGNIENQSVDEPSTSATDETGNSAVETPAWKLTQPQSRVGGKADYPRFHPMKGFSKAWRKVWNWLDDHAADITHDLPTHRDIADPNGVSHVTAGKIVKKWREYNGLISGKIYQVTQSDALKEGA
jgi:hypothetical protein